MKAVTPRLSSILPHPGIHIVCLLFLACLTLPLQGAVTGYLKIGDIPGESTRVDHEEEIDIHDIDWGIVFVTDTATGGSSGTGKVSIAEITLTKYLDKATPLLMQSCASGKILPSAVVTVSQASGDAHLDYLTITMENVIITSVSLDESGADGRLTESLSLGFERVSFEYTVQNPDGSAGEKVIFRWNLATNQPG